MAKSKPKEPTAQKKRAAEAMKVEAENLRTMAGKVERGEFRRPTDLRLALEQAAEATFANYGESWGCQ